MEIGELVISDSNPTPADNARSMAQKANAMLFVADLQTNASMKQQWQSLIADIKEKIGTGKTDEKKKANYQEKLTIIDNWIANKGYDATASAVLALTKTPFYEDYQKQNQASPQSDAFVQDLLSDNKLLAGWQAALAKTSKGDSHASVNFLKGSNYRQKNFDCNPIQVRASFIKMRNHYLNYWCGIYGNSVITPVQLAQEKQNPEDSANPSQSQSGQTQQSPSKSTSQAGPIIIVSVDSNSNPQVSVDSTLLTEKTQGSNEVTYKNGVLTWKRAETIDAAMGLYAGANHSGKLTFSQVTRAAGKDGYVGNEFFGTITYPENGQGSDSEQGSDTPKPGSYSILGRIGKPPKRVQLTTSADGKTHRHIRLPPKVHLTAVQKIQKYIGYLGMVMTVGFALHIAIQFGVGIAKFFSKDGGNEQLENDMDEMSDSDVETMDTPETVIHDEYPQPMEDQNLDDLEGLPSADNIAEMENAVDNISEDGTMQQPEEDPTTEDEQGTLDDETEGADETVETGGSEAEEVVSEISELGFL